MEIFTKKEWKEIEEMQKKAEEKRRSEEIEQNKRLKKELNKRYILLVLQAVLYLFMVLNIKGINGAFVISYILIFYIIKNIYNIFKLEK